MAIAGEQSTADTRTLAVEHTWLCYDAHVVAIELMVVSPTAQCT
jgi:hypothetical protein